jgi:sugar lactone lactonase YvrE
VPHNKRVFVMGSGPGAPDGATVDSEGYLWNAWIGADTGGGDIRRYSPDGRLDRRIELPTLKVTSVMFGGPNLDVLYVTSMGLGGFPEDRAADGGLFAIAGLGVHGIPEPRFGG